MKNRKKILMLALLLSIVGVCIFVICIDIKSNKETITKKTLNIDLQNFNLKDREKLFIGNELLIGQTINELENGYYDFKVTSRDDELIITLNKLWYQEYGEDFIQDEYLAKICREIVRCLETDLDKEELQYQLYKYIKDNYAIVKKGKDGDKKESENICIYAKSILNECVMYIKVE